MATERIIGIDFGTSTSFVKVKRYEDGKPAGGDRYETKAVVFDGNGSIAVPTVIQQVGEQYWFGLDAESIKPGGVIYRNFKVDLENQDSDKSDLARKLTKLFFRYIYGKYNEQRQFFGDKADTERTLVSYPAKWSEETALFMVNAAKEAGFSNVSGVDEATAAINAVMVQKTDELQEKGYLQEGKPVTLMLIDMGAGTTDIAVCRYTAGSVPNNEIIATWPKADGDILFGGREVDGILCEYLTRKLRESGMLENVIQSLKTLKMGEIKAWKEYTVSDTLSRDGKVEFCTVLEGLYMIMGIAPPPFTPIDRAFFEELSEDYLKKFAELVNGCIEYTKSVEPDFDASDISFTVLTGGHSQWYFTEQILTGKLKSLGEADLPQLRSDAERVLRIARPQETVSMGLAYGVNIKSNIETVASSKEWIPTDDFFVTDDNWIYYIDEVLYKVRLDGKDATVLNDDIVNKFTVIGDWIYMIVYGDLLRMRTDGSSMKKISDYGEKNLFNDVVDFRVSDDWIYYRNYTYRLYKVSTDGKIQTELTDDCEFIFKVNSNWIYYSSINGGLYRIRTDGQETKQLIDIAGPVLVFDENDNWIYYLNENDNNRFYKIRTDGTLNTKLDNDGKLIQSLIFKDDWIYLLCGRFISKIRANGTMKTLITTDVHGVTGGSCEIDDWIYYFDDGCVYRIQTDGTNRTELIEDVSTFAVRPDCIIYKNKNADKIYKMRTDGSDGQLLAEFESIK